MANNPEKSRDFSDDGIGFRNQDGEQIFWLGTGSLDPSVTGINAPIGSSYRNPDGLEWLKTGALDTDWIKTFANVFSGITPPLIINHNGNLSNGQLLGYTNLVNNPIVVGFRSKLARVTYYNTKSNADADFRFYKQTETPANLFHTESLVNVKTTVFTVPSSPIFEIGDLCRIYFDDTGSNPSDVSMGLFFEAVI